MVWSEGGQTTPPVFYDLVYTWLKSWQVVLGSQEAADSEEEEREWFEKAQGLLGSGDVPFLDMAVVIHMSLSHSLGHTF